MYNVEDFYVHVCNSCQILLKLGYLSFLEVLLNCRDVPLPVVEVRTGDFDGDGVVDILTLHDVVPSSEYKVHHRCYVATVHWCMVVDDGVTIHGKWLLEGLQDMALCSIVTIFLRIGTSSSVLPNISSPSVLE